MFRTVACRGGGGHGPRAQALEGAPAQLVGANFKSRGEFQTSKSSIICYGPRSLCIRGSFFSLSCSIFSFFSSSFFPACRFYSPGGKANYGGGGRRCKHWPPGAGDPRYATGSGGRRVIYGIHFYRHMSCSGSIIICIRRCIRTKPSKPLNTYCEVALRAYNNNNYYYLAFPD